MSTIADEISHWADQWVRGSGVMTRNTDAYNHMLEGVAALQAAPWAQMDAEPAAKGEQPAKATQQPDKG